MAYFENFPKRAYDPHKNGNSKTIEDILVRVKFKDSIKTDHTIFERYDIKDGETPESIAYREYGNPNLHWVILMLNEITDPFYGWPLSSQHFERYVNDKYLQPEDVHHYEIPQSSGSEMIKIKVSSDVVGASEISNYQYEANLNDEKKQIKLLLPAFLGQIIGEFNEHLSSL